MSTTRPRTPAEIDAAQAARALVASSEAALQTMHLRRAFDPDERALMVKALLAYAGMVPLEGSTRRAAKTLIAKIEEDE